MPIRNKNRRGSSTLNALLMAFLIAGGFAQFFPLLGVGIILSQIPVITDITVALAKFPIRMFSLQLPESDRVGHMLVISCRIYAVAVFGMVYVLMMRLQKARPEGANDAP